MDKQALPTLTDAITELVGSPDEPMPDGRCTEERLRTLFKECAESTSAKRSWKPSGLCRRRRNRSEREASSGRQARSRRTRAERADALFRIAS